MLGNSTNIFADEVDEDYVAEIAREEIEIVEMEVSYSETKEKSVILIIQDQSRDVPQTTQGAHHQRHGGRLFPVVRPLRPHLFPRLVRLQEELRQSKF